MKSPFRWFAIALLFILFCFNVYRAITQSVVHDEALTHQYFLRGPFSDVWTKYNANNHVLHTILCRISTGVFGLSEWSLRLPSLLGGALYLIAVYRLTVLVFRDGPLLLLTVGLLSLNPFILDYLSAARGYGMASALLLWAIYLFLQLDLGNPQKQVLWKLGLSAGLSVAANLTLLFPVTALMMVLLGWSWLAHKQRRLLRYTVVHAAGPAVLSMVLLFALPAYYVVQKVVTRYAAAQTDNPRVGTVNFASTVAHRTFYTGAPTLQVGFESLVWASFFGGSHPLAYTGSDPLTGTPGRQGLLIAGLTIAAIGYGGVCAVRGVRKRAASTVPSEKLLIIVSATMVVALAGVVIAHLLTRFPYPELRTGLYWIPLATLAVVALADQIPKGAAVALSFIFACFIAQYVMAFRTDYYLEWRYSAAARPIVERIRSLRQSDADHVSCVGATWQMEPSLNFYRDVFGLRWLEEIVRQPVEDRECDFYVLLFADRELASSRRWRVLLDDPGSGAMLAVPQREN